MVMMMTQASACDCQNQTEPTKLKITAILITGILIAFCAQAQFTQMPVPSLINVSNPPLSYGGGVSFYDFNYDGWDDLSIVGGSDAPVFLVNNNGVMEPAPFSIPSPGNALIQSLLWVDYDNNGLAELFISKQGAPLELWKHDGDFNFTNIAAAAGLEQGVFKYANAAFADYDHDGCLDLMVSKYYSHFDNPDSVYANVLYRNNCDGTFTDVTVEAGVHLPPRMLLQPVFVDVNNDGWEDLFWVVDRIQWQNELFINNQNGTFTRVSESAGVNQSICAMSGTVGDFDQNQLLDIYVTNNPLETGNLLLNNLGNATFADIAQELDVHVYKSCWGAMWIDFDNNSWDDLFVSSISINNQPVERNEFFINNQGDSFLNTSNLPTSSFPATDTYTVAKGDINNDGYYDYAANNKVPYSAQLFINDGGNNNFLSVSLEGTLANKDAIGTWLHCHVGGEHLAKYTHCGENLSGQNSRKNIFGIGGHAQVDSLIIEWNSGTREVYLQPDINTHHHYIEGASLTQPFDLTADGNLQLCPGESLILNAGVHPSYLWNTGDTTQSITVSQGGAYYVQAWNAFGLSAYSDTVVVTVVPQAEVQFEVQHVSCTGAMDGSILAQISTGPVQEITWNTSATDTLVQQLGGGIYSFTALDSAGCVVTGEVSLSEPPPLIAQALTTNALCFGDANGTVQIDVIGGSPPYTVDWNNTNPVGLPAGNYNVVITDAHGCVKDLNFEIHQPDSLWMSFETGPASGDDNGWVNAEAFGGTPPFEWLWSTGESGVSALYDLAAGNYSLTITDDNDCESTGLFTISSATGLHGDSAQSLLLFPNPTQRDAILEGCLPGSDLVLFDVFGREIWRQRIASCPFNLTSHGLPAGQYILQVNYGNASQHLRLMVVN